MTIDITAPIVLKSDVLLVPVHDIDEEVRRGIECEKDDVAISRPRSRTTSTVVDASAARLVELFRKPRPIVEAVILFARADGLSPQDVLEDAYALVRRLMQSGFLMPADAAMEDETGDEPALETDLDVDGARVIRPVYLLEDTEIYLARGDDGRSFALKVQRPGCDVRALFRREAEVLRRLGGGVAPALEREGAVEGRPYLLMEWCRGIDVESAAMEVRGSTDPDDRRRMLELLRAIARAYAELHAHGVVHGDVHPRNILVEATGTVRLIDFGLGRDLDSTPFGNGAYARGGIPFYYEPEFARAALEGRPVPQASEAGEQYAVGALLYELVTGVHYSDFSMGREAMLREVLERSPTPLAERGVSAWPELEAVLFRALAKDPMARFPSMASLSRTLEAIEAESVKDRLSASGVPALAVFPSLSSAAEESLDAVAFEAPLYEAGLERAPTASVNYGAAGIALALLRVAMLRSDAGLLALADGWCRKAEALVGAGVAAAFANPELEITAETVGFAAPLHARSGVHLVRALIARAMDSAEMQAKAAADFVETSQVGHRGLDLTLGRSATLLGASLLVDAQSPGQPREPLLELGRGALSAIWEQLDAMPAIARSDHGNLGAAHGWAGFLYAALQWHRASGDPLPATLEERLTQLARLAEPTGRGVAWRWSLGSGASPSGSMPGWCNGTSGHLALWSLAHRLLAEPAFRDLALAAAWDVWDAPDTAGSLCCGLTGRAYALLNIHRLTGDHVWLSRARKLGERAARYNQFEEEFPFSLYKGRFALGLLAADLEHPQQAAHPLFEEERWPRPVRARPARIALRTENIRIATPSPSD
jgi:serine/threonine-protein kinase